MSSPSDGQVTAESVDIRVGEHDVNAASSVDDAPWSPGPEPDGAVDSDIIARVAAHGPVEVPVSELRARFERLAARGGRGRGEEDGADDDGAVMGSIGRGTQRTVGRGTVGRGNLVTMFNRSPKPDMPMSPEDLEPSTMALGAPAAGGGSGVGVAGSWRVPAGGQGQSELQRGGSFAWIRDAFGGKDQATSDRGAATRGLSFRFFGGAGDGSEQNSVRGRRTGNEDGPEAEDEDGRDRHNSLTERQAPFLFDMQRAQQPLLVIEYCEGWPTAVYRQMRRHEILDECRAAEGSYGTSEEENEGADTAAGAGEGHAGSSPKALPALGQAHPEGDRNNNTHLQARDLRIVDPEFEIARDPAILARRSCLVINLPPVRAIILPDRCLFFPEEGADMDLAVMLDRFAKLGTGKDKGQDKGMDGEEAVVGRTVSGAVRRRAAGRRQSTYSVDVSAYSPPDLDVPVMAGTAAVMTQHGLQDVSDPTAAMSMSRAKALGNVSPTELPFEFYALETFLMACLAALGRQYRDLEPLIDRLTGGTGMPPPMLAATGADDTLSLPLPKWDEVRYQREYAYGCGWLWNVLCCRGTRSKRGMRTLVSKYVTQAYYTEATTSSMVALTTAGVYTTYGHTPPPSSVVFEATRAAKARIGDLLTRAQAVHRVLADLLDNPADLRSMAEMAVVDVEAGKDKDKPEDKDKDGHGAGAGAHCGKDGQLRSDHRQSAASPVPAATAPVPAPSSPNTDSLVDKLTSVLSSSSLGGELPGELAAALGMPTQAAATGSASGAAASAAPTPSLNAELLKLLLRLAIDNEVYKRTGADGAAKAPGTAGQAHAGLHTTPSALLHGQGSSSSNPATHSEAYMRRLATVKDAAEVLLEAYLAEVESLTARVSLSKSALEGAEDTLNLVLASNRNRLLRVEILISSMSVVMALCMVVAGYYGMNTTDVSQWQPTTLIPGLEGKGPWLTIVVASSSAALLFLLSVLAYVNRIIR